MTKYSLLFLVTIAACGKSSSKTENAAPAGSAVGSGSAGSGSAGSGSAAATPVAAPATLPPCPTTEEALTAKLEEIFKTKGGISNAGCVAGKFPQPGWWVTAYISSESSWLDRTVVIDAKGAIVSSSDGEIAPGQIDSSGSGGYRAIDFDKDGTDEVLYVFSSDRRGYAESTLQVTKLVNGTWESALSRTFSYDSSAAVENESEAESCEATWEVDANQAIVFTPKGKTTSSNTESCVLANETWTMGADGKFAKAETRPATKKKK